MLLRTGVNGQGWNIIERFDEALAWIGRAIKFSLAQCPRLDRHCIQSSWLQRYVILIYMKYLDAFLRVLNLWLCSVDFGLEYRYRLRRLKPWSNQALCCCVVCSCASFSRIHDGFWIGTRLISSNIQQVWCVWARSWMSICFIVFNKARSFRLYRLAV
jgi:hypothetical protein